MRHVVKKDTLVATERGTVCINAAVQGDVILTASGEFVRITNVHNLEKAEVPIVGELDLATNQVKKNGSKI